jgi:hypothetical protein
MVPPFGALTPHHGAKRRREQEPSTPSIEMAFAKLKALLRKAAARTYDDLWKAIGTVCDLFTEDECLNYLIAAGYEPNWP